MQEVFSLLSILGISQAHAIQGQSLTLIQPLLRAALTSLEIAYEFAFVDVHASL